MNTMVKVYIPQRTNLNEQMLKENFEIVNSTKEADVVIAQSTLAQDFDGDFSKVIYIAVEPPLSEHRLFCYSNFDKFKLVVTHNADTSKGQWFFTDSDEPQYYPCRPDPSIIPQYTRANTSIKKRGIFYAGMIGPYEHVKDCELHGGKNLTKLRRELGNLFKEIFPSSVIIGIGWNGQKEKVSDWRLDKSNKIKNSDCDFVLALENTSLPNYLYEKIWDGFASDRVTLYLGDTRIEEHIPENCYINLKKWYYPQYDEFDFAGLATYLKSIKQEEYDEILKNARQFRETAKGRHQELQDKLTKKIIDFINNGK